ncbi:MAG: flavin reductase [Saprospiraceae bacterium]|nr:flavin reductase [Saprospiraceae bacterium]
MQKLAESDLVQLDVDTPIWDRTFMVAPLVIIGTQENDGYDLAPKHMATPMGFDNYFGFVCTPNHGTYHNVKKHGCFTVSFPTPDQIITASLSASPRSGDISKSAGIIEALPIAEATSMHAPLLCDAYLYFECDLFKIVDGFGENSLITGSIRKAFVQKGYLRISELDEADQLQKYPLLAYIAMGRFANISNTYNFPFPKDFKR